MAEEETAAERAAGEAEMEKEFTRLADAEPTEPESPRFTALTADEHADLTLRLEQLIGEYAAASQRSEAVEKLHVVLERVAPAPEAEPVAPAE